MKAATHTFFRQCARVARALFPKKRRSLVVTVLSLSIITAGLFGFSGVAMAQGLTGITGDIVSAITWLLLQVATVFIQVTIFLLRFFILVAGYNNYINAPVVLLGWNMVRDVANMFFIVVLMVIAFGTILGLEQYEWRKSLVKLIVAAIFVNFSNLILQIMIDVAQVFTTTFLNAIAPVAGGNLIEIFNLQKVFSLAVGPGQADQIDPRLAVFGAGLMALIFSAIAMGLMLAYTIIVLLRMVFLWVAIILSPLAFIFSVLPQTKSYADEFWKEFTNHVLAAPIMVFFMWLAFGTFGGGTLSHLESGHPIQGAALSKATSIDNVRPNASFSEAADWDNMANFAVAVAFLVVGADRVRKLGVQGGGLTTGAVDFGKKVATIASGYAVGRSIVNAGGELAKKGGRGALRHMPLVGTEKLERYAKTFGHGIAGLYYGKGYEATPTGDKLRDEIMADTAKLELAGSDEQQTVLATNIENLKKALEGTTDEEKKKEISENLKSKQATYNEVIGLGDKGKESLREGIKEKEKQLSGEMGGGLIGKLARMNVASTKRLKKTEDQAEMRKKLLFKRTGSEAGGYIVGMGRLGDKYKGKEAQDRIERGWYQAEEMRSKAKDDEFEAIGRKQVLLSPRLKFDAKTGKLSFLTKSGTVASQIAEHQMMAGIHQSAIKTGEEEAKLRLSIGGAKVQRKYEEKGGEKGKKSGEFVYSYDNAMMQKVLSDLAGQTASEAEKKVLGKKRQDAMSGSEMDKFLRFVDEKVEANFESLAAAGIEDGITEVEKFKKNGEAADADSKASKLEKEAKDNSPALSKAKTVSEEKRKEHAKNVEAARAIRDEAERLAKGKFDVNNENDRALLSQVWNMDVTENISQDALEAKLKQSRKSPVFQAMIQAKLDKADQAHGQVTKDEEMLKNDIGVAETKAKEIDDNDPTVIADRQEKMTKANEIRQKQSAWRYATALAKQSVAGQLKMASHTQLLADAEQREVYDVRGIDTPTSAYAELAEKYKKEFNDMSAQGYLGTLGQAANALGLRRTAGWRPQSSDTNSQTQTLQSLGFNESHIAQERIIRGIMNAAVKKLGMNQTQVYEGLKTGNFGSNGEQLHQIATTAAIGLGGAELGIVKQIFEGSQAEREAFYKGFMDELRAKQSQIESRATGTGEQSENVKKLYKKVEVADGESLFAPVETQE